LRCCVEAACVDSKSNLKVVLYTPVAYEHRAGNNLSRRGMLTLVKKSHAPANARKQRARAMLNKETLHHRPLDSRCNLFAD
jgi:hypothetical protein